MDRKTLLALNEKCIAENCITWHKAAVTLFNHDIESVTELETFSDEELAAVYDAFMAESQSRYQAN